MDNASRLADIRSSIFNVARKFGYSHIFRIIYPEETYWQIIVWQVKIFSIVPGSIKLNRVC